jgi:tetratricopeptide (TPR) repeat protein
VLALRGETEAMRGRTAAAAARLERALTALDSAGVEDVALRSRVLRRLGRLLTEAGENERARARLAEALSLATAAGLETDVARVRLAFGRAHDATGDFEGAIAWYDAGLAAARAHGDRAAELLGTVERGQSLCRMGRYADALVAGRAARSLAVALGDRKREWQANNLIGIVYHEQADSALAYEHFVQACDVARAMGDLDGEVRLLTNIGEAHRRLGQYDDAIARYEQILEIAPEIGARTREGLAVNLALAYTGLGDALAARRYLEEASELNAATGDAFAAGYASYAEAEAALLEEDAYGAAQAAGRAIELGRAVGSPELEWQALWASARAARLREDADSERARLVECAAVLGRMADGLGAAEDRERFLADKRAVFAALESCSP